MPERRVLYEQRDFPIFQNRMYDTPDAARNCPSGNIRLVQDDQTKIVVNEAFIPEQMTYDSFYQNEQAHSPSFRSHLEIVADIVTHTLGETGLVEVGCGKAFFLEMLQKRGCSITGFDPTYEGDNPAIHRCFFDYRVAKRTSGVILRHVLEHVQHPLTFLSMLRDNNKGGLIYIEVPCLEWILRKRAWFDIFYEHVNYFRMSDFQRIFGTILSSGRLFGGQYLYVVADLATLRTSFPDKDDEVTFPSDFVTGAFNAATINGPPIVWGAGSKGVIFSLLAERFSNPVQTLIDINPAKAGKFIPGTGLRVHSPSDCLQKLSKGRTVYVMNSNYIEEIRQMTGNQFRLIGVERE
jgi:hypothetical protein